MLVEGDRLGGADRQCMAEAEQQPARFVEPAPFRFGYVPVFRQLGSPGVGAELLHASIGQGPRIERADPPLAGDQEVEEGSWYVHVRVVRNRRVEQVGLAAWPVLGRPRRVTAEADPNDGSRVGPPSPR